MKKKYGENWEFLYVQIFDEKSSVHLLRLGKNPIRHGSASKNITIWMVPVTKIADVDVKVNGEEVVKNTEENGIENGEKPKKVGWDEKKPLSPMKMCPLN